MSRRDRKIGTFLVVSYLIFNYVRPQEFIPGLSEIRIAGILFLCTTLWGVWHIRKFIFGTPVGLIFFIGILLFISGIGAINVASYKYAIKYITELFPQCVAIYLIFDNKERIEYLLKIWCWIFFLSAIITISKGGLGPGSFIYDPNDTSLFLCMGLPLYLYINRYLGSTKSTKYILLCAALIVFIAIILTNSRGGFLGLVATLLMIWWFSRHRLRNFTISIIFFAIFSGAAISLLPEHYLQEMETINDPNDPTRVERIRTWEIAWIMYKDNIIFGVGGGNFPYNAGFYQKMATWWTGNEKSLQGRVTHSIYFQVLSELGTVGSLVYLYVMIVMPYRLYSIYKKRQYENSENEIESILTLFLILSMGSYLVAGAFISVAFYPHIPIWLTMYAILRRYQQSISSSKQQFES